VPYPKVLPELNNSSTDDEIADLLGLFGFFEKPFVKGI
jgi:hypothetical protein